MPIASLDKMIINYQYFNIKAYVLRGALLLFLVFFGNIAGLAQGLKIDDDAYSSIPRKKSTLTTDEKLPDKIDMSDYVPSIINQGNLGTCVAVSSAYYARTILEAIRLGITDKASIDKLRFSPSFLYNAIKDSADYSCMVGAEITAALEYMKNTGVLQYSQMDYPSCGSNPNVPIPIESRILDYIQLFGLTERGDVILPVKKALSENTPVIVGIQVTPSFEKLGGWQKFWRSILLFLGIRTNEDYALWDPSKTNKDTKGGHSVCMVGYDDNKFGGAFKVVNSYGKNWGDQGYFWISYTDFDTYAKYGFQAYARPTNDAGSIQLSADVSINYPPYRSDNIAAFVKENSSKQMVAYSLLQPQPSGREYKFYADIIDQKGYLYLIAANDAELKTSLLFPTQEENVKESPFIGANTKLILPSPEFDSIYRLNDDTGIEYWLFLFSEEPIEIQKYVDRMNAGNGSFSKRAIEAFGNEMIPYQKVNYKEKKIGFVLQGNHTGKIVPLLISLKHVKSTGA